MSYSVQDGSKSLQDVPEMPWIPSLGIQRCTGWLGISRVSSGLFNSPDADRLLATTASFAPVLYGFTSSCLNKLREEDESFKPIYDGPFSTATFNLGGSVCTLPHKDTQNLPWGWCSITSLGTYDPTKGGHLVLWELGIVVEFPPYSTIMIPSAILTHFNTTIQEGEKRWSIVHYNSSGLFGWLAYKGPKGQKKKSGEAWWDNPTHMFSSFSS
jgi:hypothetical protein